MGDRERGPQVDLKDELEMRGAEGEAGHVIAAPAVGTGTDPGTEIDVAAVVVIGSQRKRKTVAEAESGEVATDFHMSHPQTTSQNSLPLPSIPCTMYIHVRENTLSAQTDIIQYLHPRECLQDE